MKFVVLLLWFSSSLVVEYDGQLLRAFPRIAVAAHVNLAHRQFSKVWLFLPPLPLVIAPAFQWVLFVVCTHSSSCYSGIQCMSGAQAYKRLLAPKLALCFWYQSQQRALIANSWVTCPSVFVPCSSER